MTEIQFNIRALRKAYNAVHFEQSNEELVVFILQKDLTYRTLDHKLKLYVTEMNNLNNYSNFFILPKVKQFLLDYTSVDAIDQGSLSWELVTELSDKFGYETGQTFPLQTLIYLSCKYPSFYNTLCYSDTDNGDKPIYNHVHIGPVFNLRVPYSTITHFAAFDSDRIADFVMVLSVDTTAANTPYITVIKEDATQGFKTLIEGQNYTTTTRIKEDAMVFSVVTDSKNSDVLASFSSNAVQNINYRYPMSARKQQQVYNALMELGTFAYSLY